MQVSQKGLYALKALMLLARRFPEDAVKIHAIATEEELPEKFLEMILLELKHARIVESVRGAKGGYRLKRPPSNIFLGEIIRTIDGPLAPFGDAESLRRLVQRDAKHRALFRVLLAVRDAASSILDNTSVADICNSDG
ncbi:MAG TPA: Rrf2 family transcriptional regulator [Candidatus Acidoferrum sp.]|nr:Rrf2 family transcriptional regulator [Candidatus Acidoferrum sp.]